MSPLLGCSFFFVFSSRRRHTRLQGDWSSDVCSSDLLQTVLRRGVEPGSIDPIPQRCDGGVGASRPSYREERVRDRVCRWPKAECHHGQGSGQGPPGFGVDGSGSSSGSGASSALQARACGSDRRRGSGRRHAGWGGVLVVRGKPRQSWRAQRQPQAMAVDLDGQRLPHLERAVEKIFHYALAEPSLTLDARLAVLNTDLEPMLYGDLQHQGVVADGMGFSSELIGWIELS